MDTEATLHEAFEAVVSTRPDHPALTFLRDGETEEAETYSFAELERGARAVAADLQAAGVRPGDRVMLLQAPGWHMVSGFLGCVFAGAVAVPAYPPSPFLGTKGVERLRGIFGDAGATAIVTASSLVPSLELPENGSRTFSLVLTDQSATSADAYAPVEASPDDVVFLQYTSGSTSDPRGVRVLNRTLVANVWMMAEAFGLTEESVTCSWLPPFHDMGLIGMILTPLITGSHTVQMAPEAFLRRPERWLKAFTAYRGTFAAAPNFGYELCVRRVDELEGLDLSSWTAAVNGAEPVREHTLAAFESKFAACGFRPGSLRPSYGLAEATLLVSSSRRSHSSTLWLDPEQLGRGRLVPSDGPESRPLVSCGKPPTGTSVTICDPDTGEPCEEGTVGEIWVRGSHVCDGYWARPDLSSEIFPDGALRTGDLGAVRDGELYVTGRLKDLLIIRGRNHYPQDLEHTMETADPTLRPGCGVAVSVPGRSGEQLVLLQEIARNNKTDPREIVDRIRRAITEEHGVIPDAIVLLKSGSIPKTTSGKLRRAAAAESFRAGTLVVVHRSPETAEGRDG